MKRALLWFLVALTAGVPATAQRGWLQWGRDARHHGMAPVAGQRLDRVLAELVYDPFVEQERAEQFGVLTPHYQVPLADATTCSWSGRAARTSPAIRPAG